MECNIGLGLTWHPNKLSLNEAYSRAQVAHCKECAIGHEFETCRVVPVEWKSLRPRRDRAL